MRLQIVKPDVDCAAQVLLQLLVMVLLCLFLCQQPKQLQEAVKKGNVERGFCTNPGSTTKMYRYASWHS